MATNKLNKIFAFGVSVILILSFCSVVFNQTVLADSTNLAPFPSGWGDDWTWNYAPYADISHDTSTTYGGAYTFSITPQVLYTNGQLHSFGAVDYLNGLSVAGKHMGGHQVVVSVWVKTSGSGYVNGAGAFFGMDYYTAAGQRIAGMNTMYEASVGIGWSPYHNAPDDADASMIHWGTDWTHVQWTFTCPTQAEGDGIIAGVPANQWADIGYFLPWCEVFSWNYPYDAYQVWFSNMQIYIDPGILPTSSPTATPTVSPVPTPTPTHIPTPSPSGSPNPNPTPTPPPYNPHPQTDSFLITQQPFIMNYSSGQAFAVQSVSPASTINFAVTSGVLNGTGSVNASGTSGAFQILPTTNGTLLITTSGSPVSVYINGKYANNIPYDFGP